MSVEASVLRDLTAMDERRKGTSESYGAAVALELARQMDDPDNSATSKSLCAKELEAQMSALEARLPPKQSADAVDDIARKRDERRAAARAAGAAS